MGWYVENICPTKHHTRILLLKLKTDCDRSSVLAADVIATEKVHAHLYHHGRTLAVKPI